MKKFLLVFFAIIISNVAFAHEDEEIIIKASVIKNVIKGDVYVYNLSNAKLHTPDCEWAEKCTKNCIYVSKEQLQKMFYVPCAVCGGGVIEPANEVLLKDED